jgi:1,2-diacylglycerol 3-beta-galactosyltransferase
VLITDLQENMKYTWFPKESDYYIVCGTEQAYRQALRKPHPPELTFHTSGLLVHPKFYELPPFDIAAERERLGLQVDWPTGCMMYGGTGSPRMAQLAQALCYIDRAYQMIFLCGHNQTLADELAGLRLPYPHVIRTYTPDVPYYFALSDFLVSKPGPGTINEALVMNLRLVIDCRCVLPQERYNVKWVQECQVGLLFKNLRSFRQALRQVIASGARHPEPPRNRAIFEIPSILERVLAS